MGDGAVDRARMRAQEPVAGFARAGPDRFCRLSCAAGRADFSGIMSISRSAPCQNAR